MAFKALLKRLVDSVPGASEAVFLDWESETVDLCAGGDEGQAKFVAAHHGLLLDAAKRMARNTAAGEPKYMVIKSEKADFIVAPVLDGYFLVLSVSPGRHLAHATIALEQAVKDLRKEMGY